MMSGRVVIVGNVAVQVMPVCRPAVIAKSMSVGWNAAIVEDDRARQGVGGVRDVQDVLKAVHQGNRHLRGQPQA
jgi:hypothetical protein